MSAWPERTVPLPWGRALVTPELPLARDHNLIRVETTDGELTAAALAGIADRLQADLPHRYVEFWDEGTADRLLPSLEAGGWEPDMILLMAHDDPGSVAAGAEVGPAAPEELEPLRAAWLRADIPRSEPVEDIVVQVLAADRLVRAAVPWRTFCVREDGAPVAMAWLLGEGPTVMVEDVYVKPPWRGRGLGAAVVRAAVAAGVEQGADLVYLPTDAEGLARLFYRRLGFSEVAVIARFLKRAGVRSAQAPG